MFLGLWAGQQNRLVSCYLESNHPHLTVREWAHELQEYFGLASHIPVHLIRHTILQGDTEWPISLKLHQSLPGRKATGLLWLNLVRNCHISHSIWPKLSSSSHWGEDQEWRSLAAATVNKTRGRSTIWHPSAKVRRFFSASTSRQEELLTSFCVNQGIIKVHWWRAFRSTYRGWGNHSSKTSANFRRAEMKQKPFHAWRHGSTTRSAADRNVNHSKTGILKTTDLFDARSLCVLLSVHFVYFLAVMQELTFGRE